LVEPQGLPAKGISIIHTYWLGAPLIFIETAAACLNFNFLLIFSQAAGLCKLFFGIWVFLMKG